jgi:hypothetical protein
MSEQPRRRRRLFPRTLHDVVQAATKPLMDKQGKLYGALLRDWVNIVGPERAALTRPQRLQFAATDGSNATLHLDVRPAAAPELSYAQEQMLEQCARYFGYRAIIRIVLHPAYGVFGNDVPAPVAAPKNPAPALPKNIPADMRGVLERLGAHVASSVVKKD